MGQTQAPAELSRAPDTTRLVRAALGFLLSYGLLLLAWRVVRPAYAPLFRAGATLSVEVVDPFDGELRASFTPAPPGTPDRLAEDIPGMDTLLRLEHLRLAGAEGRAGASTFFHGYHPTAVLLALFLGATALPWSRRHLRLLLALVLLHAFVGLRCAMGAYYVFARSSIDGRPVREFSALGERLLYWSWHFLWEEPLATYLVPLGIWGLCVFVSRTNGPARGASGLQPSGG